jgi:Family of unknown function (DUF695)
MKRLILLLAVVAATSPWVSAKAKISSSDKWWTYIAEYEGHAGSTRVDMAQKDVAPVSTLPFVVIAGVESETNLKSGFPGQDELARLNDISHKIIESILATGPSLYVGTFTHNKRQEHYVYVRSVAGAEAAFRKAIAEACPKCKALFRTKADPKWDTYLRFLYPNSATMEHYGYDPKGSRLYRQ